MEAARPRRFPLWAALRPRQWIKNVVVLAAPAFAGQLTDPETLARSLLAFVLFSMAASGIYLLNDVFDVLEDRAHPVKRFRPIAAGQLSRGTAPRPRSSSSWARASAARWSPGSSGPCWRRTA